MWEGAAKERPDVIVHHQNLRTSLPPIERRPLNTGIELLNHEARSELRERLRRHVNDPDPVLASPAVELVMQIDALDRRVQR